MTFDQEGLVHRFRQVTELADVSLSPDDLVVEHLPAPHRPTGLRPGFMAVYVFVWNGDTLKVGKAGPNSDARFRSQHYLPKSSMSNLASSILKDPGPVGNPAVDEESVGPWVKQNTERFNFLLREGVGIEVLNLLEAFVQCVLHPAYEGFSSQR